ncbi:hypothetical protein [Listeria monocytogenes]|uniref:hypothetical protein n=1 Tax=Listeria monocytogenes TaxID=1639 RepID=UPI000682E1AD|nr:hypothetical protein [Listeria monocytogenes]EIJ8085472.1 hypothetical protein [Listeria monocytogenes]EJA0792019.1 hypothetical protein [Listeria monocytogenes]EJE0355418.1 hypothetical protein [Listeria monocytogenes]EJQ3348390.1 hypothetical protein [Listeria monocytogenes]EJS5944990.1 hypothetical protein [Listeria monocytogenes]
MKKEDTHNFMKKAVPIAREMEGDWNIRMKMALNSVIIDHLFQSPFSTEIVKKLIDRGVSYRRISRNYGVYHRQIKKAYEL